MNSIFIGWLVFIVVYDALTGTTFEKTAGYCVKHGFLSSSGCG